VPCDVLVACTGFERNTTLCADLCGATAASPCRVTETSCVAPGLLYLADAEIDDGAFNFFFGSSVLEYAKFYADVFALALTQHDDAADDVALRAALWGADIPASPIDDRKWSHYIAAAKRLIAAFPAVRAIADGQVARRTAHFWGSLPPATWIEANRQEWHELHTRLNGGVPVARADELPYFFDDAATWCGTAPSDVVV